MNNEVILGENTGSRQLEFNQTPLENSWFLSDNCYYTEQVNTETQTEDKIPKTCTETT